MALRPGSHTVLVFHDTLAHGPLPGLASIDDWMVVRQTHLQLLCRESFFRFEGPDDVLAQRDRLRSADRITLWIGTGLPEQLLLAWFVELLARLDVDRAGLDIAQFAHTDRHEVVGLGMLSPEQLKAHPGARPLSGPALDALSVAWRAVIAPEPDALLDFLKQPVDEPPWLQRALACLLHRFPDAAHGLNAWEWELLRQVHSVGPRVAQTIGFTMSANWFTGDPESEPPDWVGDDYLLDRIRRLANPNLPHPLLTLTGDEGLDPRDLRQMRVHLTHAGHDVLEGRANAVELNGIDDWVGGVHLDSSAGRVWWHRDGTLAPA